MSTTPDRTTGASGSTEMEQLASRLDELQRRSAGLTAALERSRKTRRLIMLAFLAFVIFSGWRFIALAKSVGNDKYQERLVDALSKSATENADVYRSELEKLVKGVTPKLSAAFSEQASKDMPLFMQIFDKERQSLMTDLPQKMSKHVEDHHDKLLRRHQDLLKSEFPAVEKPEVRDRMMANVSTALDRLLKWCDSWKKAFRRAM